MGIFISVPKTIECVICALVFSVLYCACCYKPLGILQSLGYGGKKLFGWSRRKANLTFTRHTLLAMLCALASAVISLCFSFAGEWSGVIGLSAYVILFALYVWADNKVALRSPASPTPRFKRLYAVLFLITAIFVYLAVTLLNFADAVWGNRVFSILRYCPLSVFPLLIIPIIMLASLLAKVYEVPHNKSFVKKAKKKLAASDIKVIGITGSYGKTSTKQILTKILSQKYRVLSTPRSHNTPLGLALTINSNGLENYDIFIAEMGARHLGDIAELCEFCPPDYSVITGICPQHLESFKTVENIVKAKGEILSSTKQKAVIADDCFNLFEAYPCTKLHCDCIKDVVCGPDGCKFTLTLGGESAKAQTKLLGRHSADNIAIAARLAYEVGMSLQEIVSAIAELDYIEHRLQLIKSGDVNILDDGYNSNVKGAAAALEVLKSFDGRKIVVTPGLVELGVLVEEENALLGAKLVGLDLVILVGDTLITPVKQGYLSNGGDTDKLVLKPSLAAAQEELKKYLQGGDTVLFLNDLPDIY
ncbi:MAG: UDP-N-acetylmuramoyl-tripeptide--D-alanyl-D-alanine ligase [Clostridia bacterium]|nr:UDP-N-acetylmuramoyl-tripeptide--D-alanyl-D-alanine ligase [Clostridia bacterium]